MEDNEPKGEDIALIGASPATWQSQATDSGPTRLPSRALVVDDSLVVAEVVTTLLRRTGWTVDVATSVDAALEHVRGVPYDLVVCDVCMPDGGGPAVYYAATTRRPDLTSRFLFIAGNVDLTRVSALARAFMAVRWDRWKPTRPEATPQGA